MPTFIHKNKNSIHNNADFYFYLKLHNSYNK